MSKVDLSKLQAGDTVHFRCGGSAVVRGMFKGGDVFTVSFDYDDYGINWHSDGKYYLEGSSLIDIMRIEPKPFDWADVKAGMAFKCPAGRNVYYYICTCWGVEDRVLLSRAYGFMTEEKIFVSLKSDLTRAPEYDIEV